MNLDGANVLLTGGSRGIGPFIARALLGRGARLTITARSHEDLERQRSLLGPDRVAIAAGDVAHEEGRAAMVAAAEAAFGPVDVLVNNAGIERVLPFAEHRPEEISEILRVNLDAPIQLTRLVLPGMVERGRGHIANISSLSGKAAPPYHTIYGASKHGLTGFTLSLRSELRGTGVSASAICPGYVAGAGMFAKREYSERPKGSGAWTTPAQVARATVRAIQRDLPDVIVAQGLSRLVDVSLAISPTLTDELARRMGAWKPQEEEARNQVARRRAP